MNPAHPPVKTTGRVSDWKMIFFLLCQVQIDSSALGLFPYSLGAEKEELKQMLEDIRLRVIESEGFI